MTNTTNTKEHIGQKEKSKGIQFPEELSIRDYFAAKAMQRLFALDRERKLVVDADENARTAYEWADAMLKAREQ